MPYSSTSRLAMNGFGQTIEKRMRRQGGNPGRPTRGLSSENMPATRSDPLRERAQCRHRGHQSLLGVTRLEMKSLGKYYLIQLRNRSQLRKSYLYIFFI